MDKREKVIANVTAIVSDMQEEVDEWKDYSDSELSNGLTCDCDWWYKTLQTLKDAIDLLKAEAPRVMTPTEIAALKENDIVWYEQHGTDGDFIAAMVADGREFVGNASMGVKLRYLDQNERLWTSHPTDEQRAATPWKALTS